MAIRAANDAFVDFRLQRLNRRTADDHTANVAVFRTAHMIEVEHHYICLIAVDTRVLRQMFQYQSSIAFRVRKMQRIAARVVHGGSTLIMLAKVCVLARLAVRTRATAFLAVEFVDRFVLFAAWAKLHKASISVRCATIMA
jgi:hypothetical protein